MKTDMQWTGLSYRGEWEPFHLLDVDEWDKVYATDGENVGEITCIIDDETGEQEWHDETEWPIDWTPLFWTLLPPLPRLVDVNAEKMASGDYTRCVCGNPMTWEELMALGFCDDCAAAFDEEACDD